ncbi:hypothetical protein NKH94_28120 [Mesorhizobium australicum]|uniref:hypothetical protein n=1 Tax=Mesorhizobium australicum TaxID=536018 RepID=UPI003335CE0B
MAGAMQQSPEDHVATQRNEAAMTKYQVEEIKGHTVVPSGIVVENDSMKAAEATAGQSVSPRALQDHWFRVVDEEQAAVYEYSLAGPDERPDPAEWKELSDLGPRNLGMLHGGEPVNDGVDHFYTCAVCGQRVDMRDLRQVMWHEVPDHEPLKPEAVKEP